MSCDNKRLEQIREHIHRTESETSLEPEAVFALIKQRFIRDVTREETDAALAEIAARHAAYLKWKVDWKALQSQAYEKLKREGPSEISHAMLLAIFDDFMRENTFADFEKHVAGDLFEQYAETPEMSLADVRAIIEKHDSERPKSNQ